MKILFFIGSLEPGGAERVASALCTHWVEHCGHQVSLISGETLEKDFYSFSTKILRKSLYFDYGAKSVIQTIAEKFRRFQALRKELKFSQCDIVIASSSEASILCSLASIFLGQKVVVCEHNNYYALNSRIKRTIRFFSYLLTEKLVLLTTRDIENYTKKHFPINKITVIPNPLGIEDTVKSDAYVKANLLAVGRLCDQKAFHRLIEMFPLFPSWTNLRIVGDGPLHKELQDLIAKKNLQNRILLVGLTKDISLYYRTSSVLLMTSVYEGLPMVINEANSFGLPAIAYDCPTGPRELIANGINGFVIEDDNADHFAARLTVLLNNDQLLQDMRNSSYSASRRYSISEISKIWQDLFDKIYT